MTTFEIIGCLITYGSFIAAIAYVAVRMIELEITDIKRKKKKVIMKTKY